MLVGSPNEWVTELRKYSDIIWTTRHILFLREKNEDIANDLALLKKSIENCNLTRLGIGGTENTPIAGAVSMFEQGLSEIEVLREIERANKQLNRWHIELQEKLKAALGIV